MSTGLLAVGQREVSGELLFGRADDLNALADPQMRTELERMFAGQTIAKIAPMVAPSRLADTDTMSAILGMLRRLAPRTRPSAWRTDTPALKSAQTSQSGDVHARRRSGPTRGVAPRSHAT